VLFWYSGFIVILRVLLSLCTGLILAANSSLAADLYFIQMTDPQFGMYSANHDFAHETANFEFAIANANRLRPAFVVVCGDLVNKAGDPAQIAEYQRIASHLDKSIKLYNVAGNHDVGNDPTPESLAGYRAKFGPDYYTFRFPDFAGFVLDSSLIQHPENAPQEAARQEQWLHTELEKAAGEGVRWRVVFQHIPFFLASTDEPDQYFNIPRTARDKYLALLQEYGVSAVFAGHYHRNARGQAGSLRMITNGPIGMPIEEPASGIRIVKVSCRPHPSMSSGTRWATFPTRWFLYPSLSRGNGSAKAGSAHWQIALRYSVPMPIDVSILNEVAHLRELGLPEKTALAEKIDLLRYAPGQMVFNYGDPGNALYIVRSGEVEIFVKNDLGEKIVLEQSQPGDVFGEISLLDQGPRTAWVACLGEVEVLRLDRAHFEDYVRQCTPAALNLLSVVARRLRRSDEVIRRTVTRNVNEVAAQQGTALTRLADAVPALTGSIGSLFFHAVFFAAWIVLNLGLIGHWRAFDAYPFEFLSVMVSLEAIFLTLFVLTSQNRQRARDRIRADIEFESSMNTEMKIAYLHEKIDQLTERNFQVLMGVEKLLGAAQE